MAGGAPIVLGTIGTAVTFVDAGGIPVSVSANGLGMPCVEKSAGGIPVTLVGGAAPPDPATEAYIAAMSVQPDAARQDLINDLIVGLKADGVWAKLDWLSLVAAHDAQAGRINAVNPAQVMSVVSAPAFTVDRGYVGDGVDDYLNTGWIPSSAPSPQMVQNSAHIGGWMGTDVVHASQHDFGNINCRINTHYDGTRFSAGLNGGAGLITPGGTPNSIGHWTVNRPDAAGFQSYKNGAAYGPSVSAASAAPANSAFYALAYNANSAGASTPSQFSTRRLQALHWGGSLSAGEITSLYNALSAYMTAIGA